MHGIGVLGHIFFEFIHFSNFILARVQELPLLNQVKHMASQRQ